MITALVSITFRHLKTGEVIELVKKAGVPAIEWGGDVHVPHGDIKTAEETARLTSSAGLSTASYGSYYRLGEQDKLPFAAVLETAATLGAPLIRVWAGSRGSGAADKEYWAIIKDDLLRITDMAGSHSIEIAMEYHNNTLNDTPDSSQKLLRTTPALKTYWQPLMGRTADEHIAEITQLAPNIANVHIYNWNDKGERGLLEEDMERIKLYISHIEKHCFANYAMIEFVKDDLPENFLKDAETLKNII